MSALPRRALLAGMALVPAAAQNQRLTGAIIAQRGVNVGPYLKQLGASTLLDRIALCDSTGSLFPYTEHYLGARNKDLRLFKDTQEMLRTMKPDIVLVSMEAHLAPPEVQAALEANCHVVIEKPGTTNLADFQRLVRLAEERKRELMLALATRILAATRRARELMASGVLGKPWGTSMNWVGDQTRLKVREYHQSWFAKRARAGGGKLLFHGIHYLDLITFITGERITKVNAICKNVGGQPIEVEDAAVVSMNFSGGWNGTLNTGYYLDKSFDNMVRIWCSNGWMNFNPLGTLDWQVNGEKPQSFQPPTEDIYPLMFESAIRTVAGLEKPFVTPRVSLAALAAVFASYRAAETGTAQNVS